MIRNSTISALSAAVGCLCAALLACPRAWTQTEVYCTINKVETESLTNATRVTIRADGLVEGEFERSDFRIRKGAHTEPRALRIFPFRFTNARTKLGSFVDVSSYPISHLSFDIPRESREGVGLDVQVVLYRRGYLDFIWLGRRGFGMWGRGFGMWGPGAPRVSVQRSRNGRSVVIIATSDRYREPEMKREESVAEESSLSVSADENGLITVRALNSQLGEVLGAISETNGIQIAVRGGANYRASMSVDRAAPEALMRAIARAYGLSVRSVGGIYFVTEGLPTEVDSYWAAPTAYFRLKHMPATEALDLLPNFLLRYVRADEGKNALVATGPPQLLDKLDADIRAIDQPQAQIRLSAMVVEKVTDEGLDLASEIILASGHQEFQTSGDTGRLGYRVVDESLDDLYLKLRALERKGQIRTRLCPSVMVSSGNRGEVFLGRRRFFAFRARTRRGRQDVVLESTDVGSGIETIAWTGDAKSITIRLRVQANTVLTVTDEGLPLVATRRIQGAVRIESGDTIVFGGLALESPTDVRRRAGRKHLPIVGELGRAHARLKNVTEALVLLTAQASYDVRDFAVADDQLIEGGIE